MQTTSAIGTITNPSGHWINTLSDEERRGLILLQFWEIARGFGRSPILSDKTKDTIQFKQAVTVARWLDEKGFSIGVEKRNWQGYVSFAVADFRRREQTPILAQIKNPVLLKRYCAGCGDQSAPKTPLFDDDTLERRYAQALAPQLAANVGILMLLGLRRTKRS